MPVTHGVTGSSPVRTAKVNNKLKQSSEIQGFQSFFCFLYRQRITIKNKSCVGLFVGFLPVLLYSSDELELSCGIIGNSGTNIRKSINRKTFCATFSNHFVSFLELLTQNELRKFIRFSGLSKHLSKAIKKHLKSYILPIFV